MGATCRGRVVQRHGALEGQAARWCRDQANVIVAFPADPRPVDNEQAGQGAKPQHSYHAHFGGARARVCVVYGALPPEMRRMQARLFNEPGNGYDVLVASDAVGMGLNLNIRRVIFHTLRKAAGDGPGSTAPVPPSQVKQIAGAALGPAAPPHNYAGWA